MSEDGAQPRPTAGKKNRRWRIAVVVLALLVGGFGLGLWLTSLSKPVVEVPAPVASQAGFPIYIPTYLPGKFRINEHSFTVEENTLAFSATDGTGGSIAFTQQKKPADPSFNFEEFYAMQMKDAKLIDGTPFPTVMGKTQDDTRSLISVVANDTWILIASRVPLDEDIAKAISRSLVEKS